MSKLSVVIPVYNVKHVLRQCLDSVLSQTLAEWECILIDDGSTDDSGTLCDEYARKDSRFIVIHQENSGVSIARNIGIEHATGKYITFIDSDDWVSENYLAGLFEKTNDSQMALADVRCFDVTQKIYFKDYLGKRYESLKYGIRYPHTKIRSYFSTPVGKIIPADIAKKNSFNRKFDFGEDGLFMFSAAPDLPLGIKAGADVVYYRRCVSGSLSRKKRSRKKIILNQLKLLIEYWKIYLRNITSYNVVFFMYRNLAVLGHLIKK